MNTNDYIKTFEVSVIVQMARSAAEADYRANRVIGELSSKYFDDEDFEENTSGCIVMYKPAEHLLIDIADTSGLSANETYEREWVQVDIGEDIVHGEKKSVVAKVSSAN
jgi:hypothetical protein